MAMELLSPVIDHRSVMLNVISLHDWLIVVFYTKNCLIELRAQDFRQGWPHWEIGSKGESPIRIVAAFQRSEICKRSAQTTRRPQSEDQFGYQPGVQKSEDQG